MGRELLYVVELPVFPVECFVQSYLKTHTGLEKLTNAIYGFKKTVSNISDIRR